MIFVTACTWKNNADALSDGDSEETTTKPISDQSGIVFNTSTVKTNKF